MKRKNLFLLLAFTLLTQAYQNCGGSRQHTGMDASSTLAPQASEGPVAFAPDEPLDSANSLKTVSGVGAEADASSSAVTVKTIYDYQIEFGAIADSMAAPLKEAVGKYVRNTNCGNVASNEYRCGEIPFGSIKDGNRKLITTLDLGSKFEGKDGKKSFKFRPKNGNKALLRIYLDRQQHKGSQNLFYLPSQRKEIIETSAKLGDNIFFNLIPRGHFFDSQICTIVPGVDIELDAIALTGEVKKADALPFGIDAKAKGDIVIHPGQMSFGNAYVCGTLRVAFKNGIPYVSLENLSDLKFQEAKYKGLRIEKKIKVSGILGFFDDLFNLGIEGKFKDAIQNEVTKVVKKEVQITGGQVKDGTYLREYFDKAKLEPYIEKINLQIQKAFANNGFIAEQAQRVTQAACVSSFAALDLKGQALIDLTRACSLSPQIAIKGMYGAKDSDKDCYVGFFDPRAGMALGGTDWWKKSCKVVLRTEITFQHPVFPVVTCLIDAVKAKKNPAEYCRESLEDFVDLYKSGELKELIASLSEKGLNEAQVKEILTLLQQQFGDEGLSLGLLKKIFQ